MSAITTHVLDAVLGQPAAGIVVRLDALQEDVEVAVSESITDADGRCRDLAHDRPSGVYRITFKTGAYLAQSGRNTIYPQIAIVFICDGVANYHLPLLLSDNSYTTYRGS